MKTQRKMICGALVALLFVANVYGAPREYDGAEDAPKLSDKMKFGVGAGLGWVGGNSLVLEKPYLSLCSFSDFFGEYKINDRIGVRLSLRPTSCVASEIPTGEESVASSEERGCLKIAPTLRVYMGTNKKFCFFLGPQVGYLRNAKFKKAGHDGKNKVLDYFVEEDLEEMGFGGRKINHWALGLKWGWDYECNNGLIIGGLLTIEWGGKGSDAASKKGSSGSSSSGESLSLSFLRGVEIFYLGYNFAKLFN
jgi:hypothetical protein